MVEMVGGRRPAGDSEMVPGGGRGCRVAAGIPGEPERSDLEWEGKNSPLERAGGVQVAVWGRAEGWGGVRVPAGGLR